MQICFNKQAQAVSSSLRPITRDWSDDKALYGKGSELVDRWIFALLGVI